MSFANSFKKGTIVCLCSLILNANIGSAREFTNKQNKKINADIISVAGKKVELKMKSNGKTYMISIDNLTTADQEFIKKWQLENKKSPPPKKPTSNYSPNDYSYSALKSKFDLQDNFADKWPKISSTPVPNITTVKEEGNEFIYESPNYQFVCDVKLSQSVVKKFAHLFEATRDYCQALPISMLKAHIPDGSKKYKILLFETEQSYIKNGGPSGTAGVYMTRGDIIMVPLTSLGLKKVGSSYKYDFDGSNKTLPHEITHQLTNPEYFSTGADGWFSEGLAEYVSMTGYRGGKFMVSGSERIIKQTVTGFERKSQRGRNLGKKFSAPDLEQFMNQSYNQFTANGNFNYGLGALITCYFFHFEKESGRDNINAYLKALNEGKQGKEAQKALLNGRSYNELEADIKKAWSSRGVKINFK